MTVDRECDSPKVVVKDIRKVCHLVGRCDFVIYIHYML